MATAAATPTQTAFPVVFIHGVFGYGRSHPAWGYFPPYWPEQQLREINANHIIVDVGTASSDHDRACEAFYQLMGGTVDYGEEHAREKRHARYGNTFDVAMHPHWSAEHPVHIVGHSFGATTAIELYQMLCTDFFGVGSDHRWVHSIVSIAGPLTGSTLTHMMGFHEAKHVMQRFSIAHVVGFAFALWHKLYVRVPVLRGAYDLRMAQWGRHSFFDLISTRGSVSVSNDTALYGAVPAVRVLRNAQLQHMDKLFLMSITTSPRSLKNVPWLEAALLVLALVLGAGKFQTPRSSSWWPLRRLVKLRALVVAALLVHVWRRVRQLDAAKMPSLAGLMWLMRRCVNSLPVIFDGFDADHWEHNDGAVNIHSMLRPWFPKPAEALRDALSDDAQAASIPASASSMRLAGMDTSLAVASSDSIARCASHISIDGFHHEAAVGDCDAAGGSGAYASGASVGAVGTGTGIGDGSRRLRTFERGRWYVYRVDSNHLAGTHWHGEAGDLYKSLFTLMASAYERAPTIDASASLDDGNGVALKGGMSRSQSTRQLPRPASFH